MRESPAHIGSLDELMTDRFDVPTDTDPRLHAPIGRLLNLGYPSETTPGSALVTVFDSHGRRVFRTSGSHVLVAMATIVEHDRAWQSYKTRRKLINGGGER